MIKATLDQWQALQAVVGHGSYAKAAKALNKSQSTVSYAIDTLEQRLGIKVFELQGRKAVLTEAGRVLYRRSMQLLDEAQDIESMARQLASGWEPEIRLAVEVIAPLAPVFDALKRFDSECQTTRVELYESVLSGTRELLTSGAADLAITGFLPPGFIGQRLMEVEFLAVAHPGHPMLKGRQSLSLGNLKSHRQLVIRDSGTDRSIDAGWLGAERRWTVSNLKTSVEAVSRGLGFAWLPVHHIRDELKNGSLVPLPLREGGQRQVTLQLISPDADHCRPGARRLAQRLTEAFLAHPAGQPEPQANAEKT